MAQAQVSDDGARAISECPKEIAPNSNTKAVFVLFRGNSGGRTSSCQVSAL